MNGLTKADRKRLRQFDRSRLKIPTRWIQEYIRRGWIGSRTIHFNGGCAMTPYELTDEGRRIAGIGAGGRLTNGDHDL
jgi:hypothetical protein